MAQPILPGVYIEVRPEALIVPGPVTVGNIGIVGTARMGPVNEAQVIGSYAEAREVYGSYDALDDPDTPLNPFTLVRALELAYSNGASTVLAVRAASSSVKAAAPSGADLGANATIFSIEAKTPGVWGNDIFIKIEDDPPKAKVTLKYKTLEEVFLVEKGSELVDKINLDSALAAAENKADKANKPAVIAEKQFAGGNDGADAAESDYKTGLEALLNENAHIILAVVQRDALNVKDELKAHVEEASTDKIKRDRIAIVGSPERNPDFNSDLINHNVSGDRMIFVAPGIKTTDAAAKPPKEVTLPGSYAAAVIAGMLSARDPHISLTNKTASVGGLETKFTPAQLEQLVTARVLALEERKGFRVVKGITVDEGAFRQITTRRIVDFAKFGVRSAADPYIGLLNNDRVRKALKGSINGFLAGMVDDEMLVSYELDVTATRDEEIRGIARVTMTLRPTFSIDFIKVVMFLG